MTRRRTRSMARATGRLLWGLVPSSSAVGPTAEPWVSSPAGPRARGGALVAVAAVGVVALAIGPVGSTFGAWSDVDVVPDNRAVAATLVVGSDRATAELALAGPVDEAVATLVWTNAGDLAADATLTSDAADSPLCATGELRLLVGAVDLCTATGPVALGADVAPRAPVEVVVTADLDATSMALRDTADDVTVEVTGQQVGTGSGFSDFARGTLTIAVDRFVVPPAACTQDLASYAQVVDMAANPTYDPGGTNTFDGTRLDGPLLVLGGPGTDAITGSSGDDCLVGGPGEDTIKGHTGADVLIGEDGDDDLQAGGGPNHFDGGPGYDRCAGNVGSAVSCEQGSGADRTTSVVERSTPRGATGGPTPRVDPPAPDAPVPSELPATAPTPRPTIDVPVDDQPPAPSPDPGEGGTPTDDATPAADAPPADPPAPSGTPPTEPPPTEPPTTEPPTTEPPTTEVPTGVPSPAPDPTEPPTGPTEQPAPPPTDEPTHGNSDGRG